MGEPVRVITCSLDDLRALFREELQAAKVMTPADEYMLLADVATLVKVHPRTIRNWIKSKRFPHYYPGDGPELRFKRDEVTAWLEKRATEPHVDVTRTVDALKRARG